jgi:hypothetical protein
MSTNCQECKLPLLLQPT